MLLAPEPSASSQSPPHEPCCSPCPLRRIVYPEPCAALLQARVEVGILQMLNGAADRENAHHIVRMLDFFVHRQHLCLVFELLSVNLYELVKRNQFRGVSMTLVRTFVAQVGSPPYTSEYTSPS